jgi:methylmalonyl-CoA/ethylmalonyl-CoA epimerase
MLRSVGGSFHHIGIACRDLDSESSDWLAQGYEIEGPDFEDPLQLVRGRFLVGPGPRLELLVGTAPGSPVDGVIARGGKLYHQAWDVPAFDKAVDKLSSKVRLIGGPSPAVAFGGRRIAFFLTPAMNLLELIERSQA